MFTSNAVIVLLAILTVATYSLVGLLAIWAGLGRPHWFLRVAVIGGILLLLLLIPAYEPLLLFTIQSAVVILPLMLLKAVRKRPQHDGTQAGATTRLRPQFSLLDLLLLTVVVAVIVAVAVKVPSDLSEFWMYAQGILLRPPPLAPMSPAGVWTAFGLVGLGLGITTLVAAWVGLGRRLWLRLIVLCLIPTSAVMAGWLALARASEWLAKRDLPKGSRAMTSRAGAATRPTFRRLAKLAAVLLSLLILLPPVATFCVLVPPEPPQTVLPDPNGYNDVLKAAKVLKGVTVPDAETATVQQLQAFIARYRQVLDAARSGLDRQCIVPVQYSSSYFEAGLPRVQGFLQLARALLAEGKLAELEGRPTDAVRSYLDLIRLGQTGTRGGFVNHWLVGRTVESWGVEALIELRQTLTPKRCSELIGTLQTLDSNWEPLEDVWQRHQVRLDIALNWKWQLTRRLSMITGSKQDSRLYLQKTDIRLRAEFRLLISGLALRCYTVENGQPPERLADLVPDYLSELPKDPYSGKPLLYRRNAKGYVLYSVGSDGRDDGGQPGDNIEPGTDMLLDEPAEEQEE